MLNILRLQLLWYIRAVLLFCELLCVIAAALFDLHGVCHSNQAEIILHVYFTQFLSIIEKKVLYQILEKKQNILGFFIVKTEI